MKKKVFKVGDYGSKGKYTKAFFLDKIKEGKEFSLIPGHVGDWIKSGCAKTAIPLAGKFKCVEVDENDYLHVEISQNEFGKKIISGGLFENFSMGFTNAGEIDHLALLGYAPPHIKDLDKAFSEFSTGIEEEVIYIEFEEGGKMGLDEILAALGALSAEDSLKVAIAVVEGIDATEANITGLSTLQGKLWDKQDEAWYVEKLESVGYSVAKEFSEDQVREFAGVIGLEIKEAPKTAAKTEEEIRAEIKIEFAAESEKEKREGEKASLKEKMTKLFPPSMKEFAEFTVEAAFQGENYEHIIEFSEEEKIPMRNHLEKMVADGGPFKKLFENHSDNIEFSETPVTEGDDRDENKKRVGVYYG